MPVQWHRRPLLHLLGSSSVLLAGCSASSSESQPFSELFGEHPITYQHDELDLSIPAESVRVGDTFLVRLTNTADEPVGLHCGNPWTLQVYRENQWKELIWTTADGWGGCAGSIPSHQTQTERVTLARSALESQTEEVRGELSPGKYRFVLLSTDQFPAVDFHVRP